MASPQAPDPGPPRANAGRPQPERDSVPDGGRPPASPGAAARTVLGYGSLLAVASLQRTVPRLQRPDLLPVRVDGFARIFRLVSLRRGDPHGTVRPGQRVAVLDARPHPGAQMGAVRFAVADGDEAEALDRREYCYDRLPGIGWRAYYGGGAKGAAAGRAVVYSVSDAVTLRRRFPRLYAERIAPLGVNGLLDDHVLPVDDYLRLCIEGAFSWGRAFGHHFLVNTWLADGRALWTYGPAAAVVRDRGHQLPTGPTRLDSTYESAYGSPNQCQ